MMKVSVVIPVYKSEKTIEQCLKTVIDNDYGNFEVIFVLENDKKIEKIIRKIEDDRIVIIQNKKRRGVSYARNIGIKKSSGSLILLLDSDSYVPPNWISVFVKTHKEINADLIGGGTIGIHKSIYGKADGFCNWWTSIPNRYDYFLKKLHLSTNNLSVKKEVFFNIGYFREELTLGGEDAEFSFRARKNNLKLFMKSNNIVCHFDRDNKKDFFDHQSNWGRHAVKMRKKFGMDYSYLMPRSYYAALFLMIPLSILYTFFIFANWIKYDKSVILYFPLILLGKLLHTNEIRKSLKK